MDMTLLKYVDKVEPIVLRGSVTLRGKKASRSQKQRARFESDFPSLVGLIGVRFNYTLTLEEIV